MLTSKFRTLQEWFSRPHRWTQGASARNAAGEAIAGDSDQTTAMCISEAIDRIYGELKALEIRDKLLTEINSGLEEDKRWSGLAEWNDSEDRKFKHIRQAVLKLNI